MFGFLGGNPIMDQVVGMGRQQQQQGTDAMLGAMNKPFNPDAYKGFDSSSLSQAMKQAMRRDAGNRRAGALAAAQKGGVLGSGQMVAGQGDISAQQQEQENLLTAQLARQDWMDKLGQYDREQGRLADMFNYAQGRNDRANAAFDQQRKEGDESMGKLFGMGAGIAAKKFGLF